MISVKVTSDIKYNKELSDITELIKNHLIPIGREAMEHAKMNKEYNNVSWDLVNAYGFGVVVFGELVHIEVPAERNAHVVKETEDTIKSVAIGMEIALILANGKDYASLVEARGKEVLSGTAIWVKGKL